MTLDNGQKWLQEEIHTGFHLEVGDTVQILRGRMGGYQLAYVKDGKPVGHLDTRYAQAIGLIPDCYTFKRA